VYVSQSLPETATVYSNGTEVYSTRANTGVAGASTAPGTYPVYLRYTVTTMRGTNPDGSKYVDPGIPWVSYFNGGDALHGFVRSRYGFPQSDGCVEMPPANAAVVYPLTPIGTLVTVSA
jgi:lipoprotein-anchoring transpeptidase ErfK/SrfK